MQFKGWRRLASPMKRYLGIVKQELQKISEI